MNFGVTPAGEVINRTDFHSPRRIRKPPRAGFARLAAYYLSISGFGDPAPVQHMAHYACQRPTGGADDP